ncbi:MAG: hypothetical protein KIT20_06735 [Alphaproteobacteria bacterium]|nr:hypothetical protein [Alphaproteobacteria bacterium]
MTIIRLPSDWAPRPYQMPLWRHFERGGRNAVAVWHRRAGKDSLAVNLAAVMAHRRIGTYWHLLPEARQGRRVIWEALDGGGRRLIDQAFPKAIRASVSETDMRIRLKCGSVWQVLGSDNYNSLVGANPVGVVFSEYSLANPAARDFIRPILAENGGWQLYIFTARGRNHGHALYEMARGNPDWFAERLGVDRTGAIAPSAIEAERASGMSEEMIAQEYFCSFDAALPGAYYGRLMEEAEMQGRVRAVPHDPALPVETWWDIGIGDATAIWFAQRAGAEVRLIDYHEACGEGLDHYARLVAGKPYSYSRHVAPHDIRVRELGTGRSRFEVAAGLGLNFEVAPRLAVEDGIQAVRALLPRCWFDRERCRAGIEALAQYRKQWNEAERSFSARPLHDWTSHAADAFRMGAVMPDRTGLLGQRLAYRAQGYI